MMFRRAGMLLPVSAGLPEIPCPPGLEVLVCRPRIISPRLTMNRPIKMKTVIWFFLRSDDRTHP